MTTLIIKSDSEKKTQLLMKLANELGLSANTSNFEELSIESMVKGIGRKATDEEMYDYLSRDNKALPIALDTAFLKYADKK